MNTPSVGTISGPPTTLAFSGDWHGNAVYARRAIAYAAEHGAQRILHTGDLFYQFHPSFLQALTEQLGYYNLDLWAVDGNHENFDKLYAMPISLASGLRKVAPRIHHIPRAKKWTWDGVTFMGLGGAHSVDKLQRRRGISWWPQETITTSELALVKQRGTADVLISHDCPYEVQIPGLDELSGWDPEQLALSAKHRQRLSRAVDNIKPKLIIHGHYHRFYTSTGVGRKAAYDVIGLDCDGSSMPSNTIILTTQQIKDKISAYSPVDKSERGNSYHSPHPPARVPRKRAA